AGDQQGLALLALPVDRLGALQELLLLGGQRVREGALIRRQAVVGLPPPLQSRSDLGIPTRELLDQGDRLPGQGLRLIAAGIAAFGNEAPHAGVEGVVALVDAALVLLGPRSTGLETLERLLRVGLLAQLLHGPELL